MRGKWTLNPDSPREQSDDGKSGGLAIRSFFSRMSGELNTKGKLPSNGR